MKDAKSAPKDVVQKPRALRIDADIRTVVFDLDGTLYNKRGLACRMVLCLWWSLPLLIIDRRAKGALWRWIVGTRWHKHVFLPTMVWLIEHHYTARTEALDLLMRCRKRELQTAVYSDYGAIEQKLSALRIDSRQFDLLISAPELGDRKPSKASAEEVLRRLNATSETTLFIGDRHEKDGEAARAVGAKYLNI